MSPFEQPHHHIREIQRVNGNIPPCMPHLRKTCGGGSNTYSACNRYLDVSHTHTLITPVLRDAAVLYLIADAVTERAVAARSNEARVIVVSDGVQHWNVNS